MTPRINGLFSGGGLFELGMMMAGCHLQQSFEIDPECCNTLRRNLGHYVRECDITKKLVRDQLASDVVALTYPCNKYSGIAAIHGCLTGDELYLHALRHLAIQPPELYVLENVPGMRKFPQVMEAMTALPNYYVKVFCPVSSSLWLPQERDRLIIFGSRKPFAWRAPQYRRPIQLSKVLEKDPELQIPDYVYKRLRGSYRDLPIISDPRRGDIAPTCVAHYAKDRSTRLVKDHRFKMGVRPYSVREYARLQGVPDWYQFTGGDSAAYKMIGNGVSVPVGQWAGAEILRYFRN